MISTNIVLIVFYEFSHLVLTTLVGIIINPILQILKSENATIFLQSMHYRSRNNTDWLLSEPKYFLLLLSYSRGHFLLKFNHNRSVFSLLLPSLRLSQSLSLTLFHHSAQWFADSNGLQISWSINCPDMYLSNLVAQDLKLQCVSDTIKLTGQFINTGLS